MKSILMVAYHFPPLMGSSGIQRTLSFAKDLQSYGWNPIVLTTSCGAYEKCDLTEAGRVPIGITVKRAPALDTSRHLSIRGKYLQSLAFPDRWISWWPGGVISGLSAIRTYNPHLIWSSFPIATAHLIACSLSRLSGLPWIADFRDPMSQDNYPDNVRLRRFLARQERSVVTRSTLTTVTTRSAQQTYSNKYPDKAESIVLLENGYDESSFAGLTRNPSADAERVLLHSGTVYPADRNPSGLFKALYMLKQARPNGISKLRVRFRAPGNDEWILQRASSFGVRDMVEVAPSLSYRAALQEMLDVDGLLLLQGSTCNQQIPAKVYEYFRAGRPIVALTDPEGDTARTLSSSGIRAIARSDDSAAIATLLQEYLAEPRNHFLPSKEAVHDSDRRERARQLAGLLEGCSSPSQLN